jgi:hypothetical protein
MMISRRPNIRASTETAPGPSTTMASNMVTARTTGVRESNSVGEQAGSSEKPIAMAPVATTAPTIGVRKPITIRTPAASAAKPTNHAPGVGPGPCR